MIFFLNQCVRVHACVLQPRLIRRYKKLHTHTHTHTHAHKHAHTYMHRYTSRTQFLVTYTRIYKQIQVQQLHKYLFLSWISHTQTDNQVQRQAMWALRNIAFDSQNRFLIAQAGIPFLSTWIYICICAHMCTYNFIHTYIYIHTYEYTYVCICTCMCTRTHAHSRTHTHTHARTHTYRRNWAHHSSVENTQSWSSVMPLSGTPSDAVYIQVPLDYCSHSFTCAWTCIGVHWYACVCACVRVCVCVCVRVCLCLYTSVFPRMKSQMISLYDCDTTKESLSVQVWFEESCYSFVCAWMPIRTHGCVCERVCMWVCVRVCTCT